jgi:hypothetical protein
MITKEFLKKKFVDAPGYTGSSGNIYKIDKAIYTFRVYNLLSGGNKNGLDGHYCFAVNIKDFNYVIWKDSDYGSLAYVKEIKDKKISKIHKSAIAQIESIIAITLSEAYWYDGDHVNSQGENLIKDSSVKSSLICTHVDDYPNDDLGKLSKMEKEAIKLLK